MRHPLAFLSLALALSTATPGCKEKEKAAPKPGELTPDQKEKLRQNAAKAYGQIVKDYPDSPYAAEAKIRLEALTPKNQKK